MTKEAENRNYYLGIFNGNEPVIESAIKKYSVALENPFTLARRKNQELEELFSKYGKTYYAETVIGSILREHLLVSLAESIEALAPVLNFENCVTYFSYRIPFIKNPYVRSFQNTIQKIKGITVDKNISQIMGNFIPKEQFGQQLPILAQELIEFGYVDSATEILIDTYKTILEKESTPPKKSSQKVIKRQSSRKNKETML